MISVIAGSGAESAAVNPPLVAELVAIVPLTSVNWPVKTGIPPPVLLELDPEAAFDVVPGFAVVVALPAVFVALPGVLVELPAEVVVGFAVVATAPPADGAELLADPPTAPDPLAELLGEAESATLTVPPPLKIAPPACAGFPWNDEPPMVNMPTATKVP